MNELIETGFGQPRAVMQIGDIAVLENNWVYTPRGTFPLAGSQWTVINQSTTSDVIPCYAIVLTILGVWFCLLGLLFLLIRESRTSGFVQVTVTAPSMYHSTYIPINAVGAHSVISAQVDHVRSVVARLPISG